MSARGGPEMIEIQDAVERALAASTADGCVVVGAEHTEANLRFAANSLTTNGQMRSRSLTVISTFTDAAGVRAGVVTRSVTTAAELDALVRAADAAGRAASPADDAAPLVENYPHDDDWAGAPAETDIGVFEAFAPALGAVFDRWRKDDLALYGFAEHSMTSYFLGTSTGLRRRFDQPDGRLELNGKSGDRARTAWVGAHTEDFRDLDGPGVDRLTDGLAQRLDWARTHIDLPAGRYETILPPTAVADLMIYAYWNAGARDAEEGRNVFADPSGGAAGNRPGGPPARGGVAAGGGGTRIGERLATLPLRLHSDPFRAGLRCPPFEIATESEGGLSSVFDNGLPIRPAKWIADGTLTDLIRTRAWASRSGGTARPSVGNLILDSDRDATAAAPSLEDMIASTERGLLLTCLWYIREVDPQTLLLTGLTRDGVYLVENGQVRGVVNNFRFNESPVGLLKRITEIGATEPTLSREWSDYFSRTAMPPVRVPDFNMSTVSPAS